MRSTLVRRAGGILFSACAWLLAMPAGGAAAADPVRVLYSEPAAGKMPAFGSVPFPNNLYFDGGRPEAGDGTLINADPSNPDGYEKFGV